MNEFFTDAMQTGSSRLALKLLAIGALTAVILIALWIVDSVISDRQNFRNEAVKSIASSYAGEQRLTGPLLVQPFHQVLEEAVTDSKGVVQHPTHASDSNLITYPAQLQVSGTMTPSTRRHGLYHATVYELGARVSGEFAVPPAKLKGVVTYGVPYIAWTVADARGIVGRPSLTVNGQGVAIQGAMLSQAEQDSGIHPELANAANVRGLLSEDTLQSGSLTFSMDMTLAGTQSLAIVPLADTNRFELSSSWRDPLFAGQFLPRTREVSSRGFKAVWELSSLASASQQQMIAGSKEVDAVSVSLANLVDPYTMADRAVKYGILFVLLTFGGFFLFELAKRLLIHPVQYLLVGFCLTIFFLLLVSLSEHMAFGTAYLLASVACIGLLTYYLSFVLKSREYGLIFGAMLAALYASIYGLLISEDNALLLGSVMLFAVLAILMVATRRIDWYQRTADPQPLPPPGPLPATVPPAAQP